MKQRGLTLLETLMVVATTAILGFLAYEIFGDAPQKERAAKEQAERQAREIRRQADLQPRKISEANGCEVWSFKPGDRWQYFTKCGTATQTTNVWNECRQVPSGKKTRTECTPHSLTVTNEPAQAKGED